jgi:hypothetical protein
MFPPYFLNEINLHHDTNFKIQIQEKNINFFKATCIFLMIKKICAIDA